VALFVKRLPLAQVYFLKRATNGENVGITLKVGKNEVRNVLQNEICYRCTLL
jgi:hypothetical protein